MYVQEQKVESDTGKLRGVSISMADKIWAQVPLRGSLGRRHQCPEDSPRGRSASGWSAGTPPLPPSGG